MDVEELEKMSPEDCIQHLIREGVFAEQPEAVDQLRKFAERGIHPLQLLRPRMPEEKPLDRILPSFDLEGIAQYIADKSVKRVVVMCGAGISTSAGIPDFRTPGTGLYDNLQRFDLPKAESIFDLQFFRKKPDAFYELCKEMWPGNYEPTPCHYFLKLLDSKGLLLRCYSQNIDSLECLAGLPREKLVAAHGNFDAAHVIDTEPEVIVDIGELKAAVNEGPTGWQRLREEKGNLVKPKITFFGEELPARFMELYQSDLKNCDLLVVLGTSLVVQPFASLVGMAAATAPRLLINRDPAGTHDKLEYGFRYKLSVEEGKNWRDVHHAGDCDSGCRALAKTLSWEADLDALIDSKGSAEIQKAPWADP